MDETQANWTRARAGAALLGLAAACTTPPAAEAPVADARVARVDALFAEWDRADSPGCALAIVDHGRIVHARGFGSANLEHAVPITPRTVFDIGSTSKQFTAACVVLLAQDGKLALDDDVRRFVPELHESTPPITLRMLLHHTSGLRDYLTLMALAGVRTEDWTTKEDALALVARQERLNFVPGTEHLYSNTGYFLLSIVVERAAGKSLPEFARERIFEPLGMRDTHVHDDHARIVERRATGYGRRADGSFGIDMSDFEQTGDGAVMTTVEDLARWDENFYSGTIGGAAFLETIQTKGRLADGTQLDYALGLSVRDHRGLPSVAHGGAWAGYRAELLRFPTERVSVVCLCNLGDMNPSRLARQVAEVWLGDRLAPAASAAVRAPDAPHPPGAAFELGEVDALAWCGRFRSAELGVEYEIARRAGRLRVGIPGRESHDVVPRSGDELDLDGLVLRAARDSQGRLTGFTVDAGRVRGIAFERRETARTGSL